MRHCEFVHKTVRSSECETNENKCDRYLPRNVHGIMFFPVCVFREVN